MTAYFAGTRREMIALVPRIRHRILEIGCGEGAFVAALGADETWGVEPNQQAAKIASGRVHKILNGTFTAVRQQIPLKYFDVVICNDVIEHMEDHGRFLIQIKDHITNGGCLVGSIPNVRYYGNLFNLLIRKDWRYKDEGILDRTHLRFFTERSLHRTLIENGYRIEELYGINGKLPLRVGDDKFRYSFLVYSVILLTLGYFKDIRYLQFGFRASLL